MSASTNIEWTDASWPVVAGCEKLSAGCANCWAIRDAWRMSHNPNPAVSEVYAGTAKKTAGGALNWTGIVRLLSQRLDWPLRWRQPKKIFVCNQSDLFHEDVPHEFIAAVFAVMMAAPQHTFQVLTKRAERMRDWFRWLDERGGIYRYIRSIRVDGDRTIPDLFSAVARTEVLRGKTVRALSDPWMQIFNAAAVSGAGPLPNVWLGVSAEDQERADERIPLLLQTPAAVRFVSAEPLLGPVDLTRISGERLRGCEGYTINALDQRMNPILGVPFRHLDWVIAGGESGKGARACDVAWIRAIVDQCRGASVPVFCKQLGAHVVSNGCTGPGQHWPDGVETEDTYRGHWRHLLRNKKGGAVDEWPPDLRVREWPTQDRR